MNGQDIYEARLSMGRHLWEETHYEGDVVMSVPDSGNVAALGYSHASGIPYVEGLLKNKYMGRTFIQPGQKQRERAVRMKLNPIVMNVRGNELSLWTTPLSAEQQAVSLSVCCGMQAQRK